MERADDNRVMDENPYRSPETVGAGQPGFLVVVVKRVIWFCLALMGAMSAFWGAVAIAIAILESTRAPRALLFLVFGFGVLACWMGVFLIWRATKRFRRRDQAQIATR